MSLAQCLSYSEDLFVFPLVYRACLTSDMTIPNEGYFWSGYDSKCPVHYGDAGHHHLP